MATANQPIDDRRIPTYTNLCFVLIRSAYGEDWYRLLVPTLADSTNPISRAVSTAISRWGDGSEVSFDEVDININDGQQDHSFSISLSVDESLRLINSGAEIIESSALPQHAVGVRYGQLQYSESSEDNEITVNVYVQPPDIVPIDNEDTCTISYLSARLDYIESFLADNYLPSSVLTTGERATLQYLGNLDPRLALFCRVNIESEQLLQSDAGLQELLSRGYTIIKLDWNNKLLVDAITNTPVVLNSDLTNKILRSLPPPPPLVERGRRW